MCVYICNLPLVQTMSEQRARDKRKSMRSSITLRRQSRKLVMKRKKWYKLTVLSLKKMKAKCSTSTCIHVHARTYGVYGYKEEYVCMCIWQYKKNFDVCTSVNQRLTSYTYTIFLPYMCAMKLCIEWYEKGSKKK